MGMKDEFENNSLCAYTIENARTKELLGVGYEDGTYALETRNKKETTDIPFHWFVIDCGNKTFVVKNLQSSRAISVQDNSFPVLQKSPGDSPEKWKIIEKDGFYIISHFENGRFLTAEKGTLKTLAGDLDENCLWNIAPVNPEYEVPLPKPLDTNNVLVGAQMCNLWKMDKSSTSGGGWEKIKPFPDRQPVIGWYEEGTGIVTDWEIKMAVDHGISFFMPCWYRAKGNLGSPVKEKLSHWMEGLKNARYKDYIKYFLMWENINDISCGVKDENDLLKNVTPFLIEKYFKDPCYLKVDNKPLLSVYGVSALIEELGGEKSAKESLEKMEWLCVKAGFDGLILMGNFCWGDPGTPHTNMKNAGMKYSISYHWPTFATGAVPEDADTYDAGQIIKGHHICWEEQNKGAVENIINCSMGWDSSPWGDSVTHKKWRLTPEEFKNLMEDALFEMSSRDKDSLAGRMILLDNWNEFGEGHYIMPVSEYGFGYLENVRKVFGGL